MLYIYSYVMYNLTWLNLSTWLSSTVTQRLSDCLDYQLDLSDCWSYVMLWLSVSLRAAARATVTTTPANVKLCLTCLVLLLCLCMYVSLTGRCQGSTTWVTLVDDWLLWFVNDCAVTTVIVIWCYSYIYI